MSEFASLLASFKQNAAAASSNPPSRSPTSAPDEPHQHPRKRPHPGAKVRPSPSYPSFHSNAHACEGFDLSFLVIGAQKAGTSWLHALLRKCHPLALPRERKELHFWDWHYRRGFDWYVRQFDGPSKDARGSRFCGEITPCYVVLPPAAIAEIHKCFPELKVIFVARDLVERAWSACTMELRDQTMGLNAGEFAEGALASGEQKPNKVQKRKAAMSVAQQRRLQQQSSPSAQPDSYYLDRLRSEVHSSRSDYCTHLRNWFAHFPSPNILIVDYREIDTNPRDFLLKIVQHIGLGDNESKKYVENLSDDDVNQRVNVATNTQLNNKGGSLSQRPLLKKQMEAMLRPYASKFNSLLKEQGYSWRLNEYTSLV